MKPEIPAKRHLDNAYYFYEDTDEWDLALAECDAAIEIDPYLAEAHNLRAILLGALAHPTEIVRTHEQAIQLDPGFAEVKDNLSSLVESESAIHGRLVTQAVVDELLKLENSKKPFWKNLLYLAISISIFISFGLLGNPIIDLVILVSVILIHEMGHYVAMTLCGYKDVKVFFIPLLGAIVFGRAQNASATEKAIVSLAGPLPGIFLGIIAGTISVLLDNSLLAQVSLMLVFINGFNLLPIFPFDGGRFLFDVVFSRSRYGEAIFKFLAGGTLAIAAIYFQDVFIGIIGLAVLISIGSSIKIGSIAQELKQERDFSRYNSLLEAPPEIVDQVIKNILEKFPRVKSCKALANLTSELWNRLCARPPKVSTSVSLVSLYILSWVFVIMSLW